MAEKKVFAQIDVLGSNQTPMDAFIYMEDQGGGGGDEKVLTFDTATFVQAEPEQTSFPGATSVYRLELTDEQYDQIINQRYSVHLKGVSPFNNAEMLVDSVVDMVFENQYRDVDISTARFDIKTYKQTGTGSDLATVFNVELHLNVNNIYVVDRYHYCLEFAQYVELTKPRVVLQPGQIEGMSSDMSTIQIRLTEFDLDLIKNNTTVVVDGTQIGFKEATLYKDMFGDLITFETGINHDEQETLDSYEVTNMWTMTVKVDYETGMAIMMTKQFQIGGGGTGSTEINIDNQFTPLDETLTKFRLSDEVFAKIYSTIADGVLPVISMTYPIDESNISILRISVESASFGTTRSAEPTPGFIGFPTFNLVGNIAGNKMNARIYFGYDQEGGTDFPELDILPEEEKTEKPQTYVITEWTDSTSAIVKATLPEAAHFELRDGIIIICQAPISTFQSTKLSYLQMNINNTGNKDVTQRGIAGSAGYIQRKYVQGSFIVKYSASMDAYILCGFIGTTPYNVSSAGESIRNAVTNARTQFSIASNGYVLGPNGPFMLTVNAKIKLNSSAPYVYASIGGSDILRSGAASGGSAYFIFPTEYGNIKIEFDVNSKLSDALNGTDTLRRNGVWYDLTGLTLPEGAVVDTLTYSITTLMTNTKISTT